MQHTQLLRSSMMHYIYARNDFINVNRKITFKLPIPFFAIGLQINSKSVSKKQWTSIYYNEGKPEMEKKKKAKIVQINVRINFKHTAAISLLEQW